MAPGCAEAELMAKALATLLPQVLADATLTVPETNGVGNVTLMALVP